MSLYSRRALLAAVATGTTGALAGCNALSAGPPRAGPPPVSGLDGHAVFVAPGVEFPTVDSARRVDTPGAADVAVFPASETAVESVTAALDAGTVAAVSGHDAQRTLMAACAEDGRSYGFARDGWGHDTRVVAAAPHDDHLVTHLFVGAAVPRDLPWAFGELFEPARGDCSRFDLEAVSPDGFGSDATLLGQSRVRGRNAVAGFDRWDTVRTATTGDGPAVTVDIDATIFAGDAVAGDGRYAADHVRLALSFDDRLVDVAPEPGTVDGVRVQRDREPERDAVELDFSPTERSTRRSLTACQRSLVAPAEASSPVSYTANARFRWRDPRLLDDDRWHHHTPGRAMWYR